LPQLDINNTIDHRPEGDEKWFLENEKTVTQFCRKLAAERPLKDIRDEYNYPKKKGIKDEWIFVCLSMVQLMAVFISMRCTLCGHFLQVALTLILVVGYAIAAS